MAFPSNIFRLEFLYLKKFMNSYLLFHHYDADALQGSCLCLALFKICFALHAIAYYITWSYRSFFSLMVPAYTPDLNFTEGICIDPTYFRCKSKSGRVVMLMRADLCRIWYIANMFSSCFLSLLLSEAPAAAKGHCNSFQIRNIHFLYLQQIFFSMLCKSLLKSLSEIKKQTQEWFFRVIFFCLSLW